MDAKRSARLGRKREESLALEVAALQKRIDTLEQTVSHLKTNRDHEAGDYRKNRNELLSHFTTSRGGPECVVCCTKKAAPVLPCTHMAACISCAVTLQACPICRTKIDEVVIRKAPAFKAPIYFLEHHV